ncbi:MAG: hypothetical protein F6K14_03035 [Symploca sp. SIO2C1]|nr:hypothetical protein [Symploca sp. SIO2C1]
MASITIRDIPDATKEALRIQAAQSGLSLEAYLRHVLKQLSCKETTANINILDIAQQCFGTKHGIDLELPERHSRRSSVTFD